MKKHIVFITGSYGEYMSPGANIASGIIEHLGADNLISLISHKEHFNEKRISFSAISEQYFVQDRGTCFHNYCLEMMKKGSITKTLFSGLLNIKRCIHAMGMVFRRYGYAEGLRWKTEKVIVKINSKRKIDVIIAISEPHDAVFAAIEYKKKNPYCKLIVYQLDRFANGNSLYKWKLFKKNTINRNIAKEIDLLKIVDKLFIIPPLWSHYQSEIFDEYRFKIEITEHPLVRVRNSNNNKNDGRIIYAGSLDKKLRNPVYWLHLSSEAKKKWKEFPDCVMYSFGNCEKIISEYLENNISPVIQKGRVSYSAVTNAYQQCSYVLIIGNNSKEEVPSKVFDCISFGKPIIYLYYMKDDPVLPYLENYPMAISIHMDNMNLEQNVNRIISFCIAYQNKHLNSKDILTIYHKCTPEYVTNQFISALECR